MTKKGQGDPLRECVRYIVSREGRRWARSKHFSNCLMYGVPSAPAEAPLTVRSTPVGRKVLTMTKTIVSLKFRLCSQTKKDPMKVALHSGYIYRREHQACVSSIFIVEHSARRKVDVSGVYCVREGGRERGKLRFRCTHKYVE